MPNDRQPPSRPALTRQGIMAAAVALADEQGIGALSMRRLAERLGVEAMSLYHHVASKDQLFAGMVEVVAAELERPSSDAPWCAALRARSIRAREVLLGHPWAAALFVSRVNDGPEMLSYVDATLGCLLRAGFTPAEADRAWNALDSHLYGFVLQELNFPFERDQYRALAEAYVDRIPPDALPHLHALTALVAGGCYDGVHDFTYGLDLLLDGLERQRADQR